jgi:hypothetical protein
VPEAALRLAEAASARAPCAADAAAEVLAQVEREATRLAAEDETEGVDRKREHVRTLLSDVLHALAVAARDRAADRASALLPTLTPADALHLLPRLAALDAAVASNVTPAAILIEIVAALRRAHSGA